MVDKDDLASTIRAFRPFVPAKDYEASRRFYETIGFETYPLGPAMAEMSLGPHAFLLHHVRDWDGELVMHVLVDDVQAWFRRFDELDLGRFGVTRPAPPKLEPWGLTVCYVTDPSGVFWHFAAPTEPDEVEPEPSAA